MQGSVGAGPHVAPFRKFIVTPTLAHTGEYSAMASRPEFDKTTSATEVAAAFGPQIKGKTGMFCSGPWQGSLTNEFS